MGKLAIGVYDGTPFLRVSRADRPDVEPRPEETGAATDDDYDAWAFNSLNMNAKGYFSQISAGVFTATYQYLRFAPAANRPRTVFDLMAINTATGYTYNQHYCTSSGDRWGVAWSWFMYEDNHYLQGSAQNLPNWVHRIMVTNLPMDPADNFYTEPGTFSSGDRIFDQTETYGFRMAKSGFDARTATGDELLLGGAPQAMPIYLSDRLTVAASTTLTYSLPSYVPANAVVMMQYNKVGEARHIPSLLQSVISSGTRIYEIGWKIDSGTLYLQNHQTSDYEVIFFVTSNLRPSVTPGEIIKEGTGYLQFCRPDGEVEIDSRWSYAPLIDHGFAELDSTDLGDTTYLPLSVTVSIPEVGYNPFVLYCHKTTFHPASGDPYTVYMGPRFAHIEDQPSYEVSGQLQDNYSNNCTVTDGSLTFQTHCTSFFATPTTLRSSVGGGYYQSLGFTYYVFAVPDVLTTS